MLYRIIKTVVKLGMRLYYREIKVKNADVLEHDVPLIIIANHPNTIMDAWLVSYVTKQPIYFMAKGTFFNSKLKMRFLRALKLIPINRAHESKTEGVSNQASFDECFKVLEEGRTLVIYPEGSSYMERQLRELKSGTARIALEAENRNNGKLNLKVVPMGLIYIQADKFRSSVFVNIGKAISVNEYLDGYNENSSLSSKKLTEVFRGQLEKVLVTTQNKEQEELIDDLVNCIESRYSGSHNGVEDSVELMKKVRNQIEFFNLMEPWKIGEIQALLRNINWRIEKMNIKADFLDRKFRSVMFIRQIAMSILVVLFAMPLFIAGFVVNVIPYKLTDILLPRLVQSVEYHAAVAIIMGLFLYPINYFLCLEVIDTYLVDINLPVKTILFFTMPLLGIFAHTFYKYLLHISTKINYLFLIMNDREALVELQNQRKKLVSLVLE